MCCEKLLPNPIMKTVRDHLPQEEPGNEAVCMSVKEWNLKVEDDAPKQSKGFLSVPLCNAFRRHSGW